METKTIKGKKKKEYKIAVVHKLNNTFSSTKERYDIRFKDTFSLYVEVRAKRQRSFFRSLFPMWINPNNFDKCLQDPIYLKLIDIETELITNHLKAFMVENDDVIDMPTWHCAYKEYLNETLLKHKVTNYIEPRFNQYVKDKNFEEWAINSLIKPNFLHGIERLELIYSLIHLINKIGDNSLSSLQNIMHDYFLIQEIIYDNISLLNANNFLMMPKDIFKGLSTKSISLVSIMIDQNRELDSLQKKKIIDSVNSLIEVL